MKFETFVLESIKRQVVNGVKTFYKIYIGTNNYIYMTILNRSKENFITELYINEKDKDIIKDTPIKLIFLDENNQVDPNV